MDSIYGKSSKNRKHQHSVRPIITASFGLKLAGKKKEKKVLPNTAIISRCMLCISPMHAVIETFTKCSEWKRFFFMEFSCRLRFVPIFLHENKATRLHDSSALSQRKDFCHFTRGDSWSDAVRCSFKCLCAIKTICLINHIWQECCWDNNTIITSTSGFTLVWPKLSCVELTKSLPISDVWLHTRRHTVSSRDEFPITWFGVQMCHR